MRQDKDLTKNMLQFLKCQSVSCKASTLGAYKTGLKPFDPLITQNNTSFLKVPLGKMNTERLVPLSEETLTIIRKIQNAYPVRPYGCSKARLIGLVGPICTVRNNLNLRFKKITTTMIDQNKPITFHRLRHTYATTLLSAGVGIVSIMKLLGHRRITSEMSISKLLR